ncbi:hypothetical protein WC3_00237 [Escherichia coli KTE35]|nr:hypothetical protein WC3_00237 [Escherichia coli KTE35]EOV00896.1 hypothetical protein WEY_00240 [Escherichia coli KTE34]
MDYWLPIIVLFGAFFFMLALGVPIVGDAANLLI